MKHAISMGNSQLGRLAIGQLLERGAPAVEIVAVARDTAKAADLAEQGVLVRPGEYGNDASLVQALDGVDNVYMISGMAPPVERIRQHRGFIDAAKQAGVSHIVYSSFIDTAEDSPFFAWSINKDTESYLESSGLAYTILRNGMYSEADLDYIDEYVKAGKVANNIGAGRISYISRRDLALAATHCLTDDGHVGRIYTLTGPEAVTQERLAEWISRWTGEDIAYKEISDEEYRATFPTPEWAEVIVALYQSVRLGNVSAVTDDFERITGRKAYTVPEVYESFYARTAD